MFIEVNFIMTLRNFLVLIFLIINCPRLANSQTLGGYPLYGHLANAIHPTGCSDGYVAHFPDDSIWVNLNSNVVTTGNFSLTDVDSTGNDLLLETGFHPSSYIVSLLLTSGIYSTTHSVFLSDWDTLPGFIAWQVVSNSCFNQLFSSSHYMLSLDYDLDFGIIATDTVQGIKIEFQFSPGAPDFAGAYLINLQDVGINDQIIQSALNIFPNPFSENVNIKMNNNEFSEFILYDITSRIIIQQKFTSSLR